MKEEKLLSLLQKKRGFFEAMLDLTEREQHIPLQELLPHLEHKRTLLGRIEEIDHLLTPLQSSIHILSQEITEELDHIRHVIEALLHIDQKNQEKRKRQIKIHE